MNNTYRLVWNNTLQAWVVASELAKSHKKSKAVKLAVALVAAALGGVAWAAPAVDALPTGEVIPGGGGSATFDRSVTNQLTVNQSSSKLITNWTGFNIGSSAKVIFNQPDASSIALNRVTGGTSEIFGQLSSNGQLMLVNPAGFTFGSTAQVNVGSLVASAFSITDANFNAGNYKFTRIGTNANVDNFGSITTTAGDVTFLAPFSYNYGSIVANGGNVNVLNAQDVNLSNTLAPTVNTVSNTIGLIRSLGSIQANSVSNVGGRILLRGDTSTASSSISVAGRLQADDSISANGKTINLSNNLQLNGNTSVTAADNINVHAVTDLASNKALTLTHGSDAGEGFYLSSGARLNLGSGSTYSLNGQNYTVVYNISQLQALGADDTARAGRYVLANDIDASSTSTWSSGAGFAPIGSYGWGAEPFSGKLDGLGHTVKSLYINRPTEDNVGLFGYAAAATIQNIGLLNPQITGGSYVAALAGLVRSGFAQSSLVHNSYVEGGSINGGWRVGGLLGQLYSIGANSTLSQSYSNTTVSGNGEIAGGLVADLSSVDGAVASISNSYSTGVVNGGNSSGGLVGYNGTNTGGSTQISNSYSTSKVVSGGVQGALVGQNNADAGSITIDSSYASGQVSGAVAGGLVGRQTAAGGSITISNSYWDSDTTGQSSAVAQNNGGTLSNVNAVSGNGGANPSAFDQTNYANLNFGSNWFTINGQTRPMLRAFLNASSSGNNSIIIPVNTLYQLQAMGLNMGNSYRYNLTQNIDASATQASVTAGIAGNYSDVWGGKGFSPLASTSSKMQATLDGESHIISRLGINRPGATGVGLIAGAVINTIKNIGLQDVSIVGGQYTGALIGYGIQVAVDNSFATGQVTGSNVYAGGLIGLNDGASIISNSYTDVDTHGDYYVGGLLGYNAGTLLNSYASGSVTATTSYTGGLVALNNGGTVTNSYWDTVSTGQSGSGGGTGISTAQLQSLSTFTGWDIDAQAGTGKTWRIYDGYAGPLLRSFLTPLTVTAGETKTYDATYYAGGVTASVATANLANILGGNYTGAAIGAHNVGSYAINVTGLYSNQQGYDLTVNGAGSLVITPAQLVIGSADVTKTYDATTTANTSAIAVNGTQVFAGDSLTGGNFAFTDKNAGTGKTVTVSSVSVNDGNGGGNYIVSYANNTTSTINKANLAIGSQLSAPYRQYDGTTSADATAVAQNTLYGTDSISGGTFTYDNKNYGIGKTVTTSNVTVSDGNGGNNYNVTYVDNTNGAILEADLLVSSTDASKVYDGSTSATATAVAQSTLFGSDSISGGTFTYDTKHAGTGKTVATSNVTVNDGNGGYNYRIIYVDNTNGSISKANLVVSTGDVSKVFDGTTAATGIAQAVSGTQLFGGDSLSGGSYAYTNKNASLGDKTVSVSGVTVNDGNSGNNYNLSYVDNTSSSIHQANLFVSSTNASKVYDGTTSATATAVANNTLYGSDSLSGGTFVYDNRNAGAGKTVTTSNVTVNDGNSGNNYNVIYVDNTNSSISKAGLVLSSSDVSKVYDGTTTAAGTALVSTGTLFGSDSISGGSFSYDNKHAGIGKHVSASNVTVSDGNSGNNYAVSYVDNTNSSISKANLVLTSGDISRVYDGSTNAAGIAIVTSGTQLFGSDSLSGGTFTYDNRNAGTGKTVSVAAVTVADGNNGGNYNVSYVDNSNSSISKANLVVSTAAVNKTYDGTTAAAGTAIAVNGTQVFGSDNLSGGTFTFDIRNTGTDKTVTVAGVNVNDGNSGNNYNLSYADNTTSSISKADLHVAAPQITKVYDGLFEGTGTLQVNNALFGSDSVAGGSFVFSNPHVGTGKTVNVSNVSVNDGNAGNNYNVIYDAVHNGVINPASLSISTTNTSKVYDGTTAATGNAIIVGGQLFGRDGIAGGTFTFGNKNVGTGKTVNVSGVTINDGNNGNNYAVTYVANTGSSISKALLLLQANSLSRVYDGTTNASTGINIASGQLFGSDSYTGGAFQFADKNVGNNKQLVLTQNVSLNDGNNGGNYLVAFVPSTTSSITPATLNIQAVADTKVYDGKINSAARPDVSGLFGSDRVTGLWQQFADDNAGTGKIINIKSGFVVDDGNGGNNYIVSTASTNTGVITPALLKLVAVTDSKVFEGNLHSTGNPLVNGLVQGDRVTGLFQQFADRNAGTGKTINIKPGYVVDDGNGGANYTVTLVANHTGVITPKQLLINAVAGSKVYDGGITSAGKPVVNGLAHGDRVTGLFQLYENKQVGTGKRLYIKSGYMVRDGNNGGNYDVVITENNAGVITAH